MQNDERIEIKNSNRNDRFLIIKTFNASLLHIRRMHCLGPDGDAGVGEEEEFAGVV